MKLKHLFILLLLSACSTEDKLSDDEQNSQHNLEFIASVSGGYISSENVSFTISRTTGNFIYNTDEYLFVSAVNNETAVYQLGDKFYGFKIFDKALYRTQEYGLAELVEHRDYGDAFATKTSGNSDKVFIASVSGKYIRNNITFDINETTGDFTYNTEKYIFISAVNGTTAVYQLGSKFYSFKLDSKTSTLNRSAEYGLAELVDHTDHTLFATKTLGENDKIFIASASGKYIRNKITFNLDSTVGNFTYNKNFEYTFKIAVDATTAIYEQGGKFFSFKLEDNFLYKSKEYGLIELVQHKNYVNYAALTLGPDAGGDGDTTVDPDDNIPNIDDGEGGEGGGSYPSGVFLDLIKKKDFQKDNYYFVVEETGDFTYQHETGFKTYTFEKAYDDTKALYKTGSMYVAIEVNVRDNSLHMTAEIDNIDFIAFDSLVEYARLSTIDYKGEFQKSLIEPNNVYDLVLGGSTMTISKITFKIDKYDFVRAVNATTAIYKDISSYYGVTIIRGEISFTQNHMGSSDAKTVLFNDPKVFANRKEVAFVAALKESPAYCDGSGYYFEVEETGDFSYHSASGGREYFYVSETRTGVQALYKGSDKLYYHFQLTADNELLRSKNGSSTPPSIGNVDPTPMFYPSTADFKAEFRAEATGRYNSPIIDTLPDPDHTYSRIFTIDPSTSNFKIDRDDYKLVRIISPEYAVYERFGLYYGMWVKSGALHANAGANTVGFTTADDVTFSLTASVLATSYTGVEDDTIGAPITGSTREKYLNYTKDQSFMRIYYLGGDRSYRDNYFQLDNRGNFEALNYNYVTHTNYTLTSVKSPVSALYKASPQIQGGIAINVTLTIDPWGDLRGVDATGEHIYEYPRSHYDYKAYYINTFGTDEIYDGSTLVLDTIISRTRAIFRNANSTMFYYYRDGFRRDSNSDWRVLSLS